MVWARVYGSCCCFRGALGVAVILVALGACGPRQATPTRSRLTVLPSPCPATTSASPAAPAFAPPASFGFGVEYMLPGLASTYAQLGVRWVRSDTSETFSWGTIEPQAPRDGQHDYHWAKADRWVAEWQNAGFDIQVYTNAQNSWASSQPQHHFPDPQHMAGFEAFVTNLVERYDGDGDRDMPGLRRPILDYTVVEEWTAYFPGTVAEYLEILTVAHRAIKRANPAARVRLVDLFLIDVFDGSPSPEEIARRAAQEHVLRHSVAEVQEILRHPDLFDIVEIHALGDYTELYPTAEWLRAEMRKNGYSKPIWIGDALPVSSLIMARGPRGLLPGATDADFYTVAPLRPQDALRLIHWLETIKDPKAPQHGLAVRWWRALQAREAVKKAVVAIDAGYAGMNYAWLVDSPLAQLPRVTGSWGYQGLVDAELNLAAQTWRATGLRPVFHSYRLAVGRLDGYSSVERLDLGAGLYGYRFQVQGRPIYALWCEPGRLYFPDEAEPGPVPVSLSIGAARATITHIVSEMGQSEPYSETVATEAGRLILRLDSRPVFVEPRA